MSVTDAGENYPIERDCKILEINSPKSQNSEVGIVGKPHVVVAKCTKKRWAIVALTRRSGDKTDPTKIEARLGIRWFHSTKGHPVSNKYCVWFILPDEKFHDHLLQALETGGKINESQREAVCAFLNKGHGVKEIDGDELKEKWKAA